MKRLLLGLFFALVALPVLAIGVDEPLPDPALEAKAREISRGLRCLVCQNQSIEDSNAPLATDLRRIVRERVTAGDDEPAVQAYLVERYGQWVLLRPPFEPQTWVLWLSPFAILVLGATVILIRRRRPAPDVAPAPLSAEERARLEALLRGEEPS
jgi:cytochrome c-type biogenesis protein CcmH